MPPIPLALPDLDAVRRLAVLVAAQLQPEEVLGLDGPLGAGKTTWVRFLVEALGGDPQQVTSPTFTLMHVYQARLPIIHVDAYRLAGPGDLAGLGFAELSEGGIGIVEWASRVFADQPEEGAPTWRIRFEHARSGGRQATITTPERLPGKWLQELGGS